MDQRICIKFCVKNNLKCADAFRMLTVAYGEATLDKSNVYRWYKMFSEGREDVSDEERSGRPSTSTIDENIDEVKKLVLTNRRITVREVAEDLNMSIGSCHSIITNSLGMRRNQPPQACLREVKNYKITHWRREVAPAFRGCKSKESTKCCCSVLHCYKDMLALPYWQLSLSFSMQNEKERLMLNLVLSLENHARIGTIVVVNREVAY
ncbi:hypothetical protein evm_004079 [Chilo suppressalis]|nr:hypothetical protein evm_004079 [Chilo suppressalis]